MAGPKRVAATAAGNKKKSKKTAAAAKPRKPRPPNFTKREDVLLTRAFVSVSTDATVGNDQKGTVFWARVKEAFQSLVVAEDVYVAGLEAERDQKSLMDRFKRQIQTNVFLFNSSYRIVKKLNPSGTTEDDIFQQAMALFQEENNKQFLFAECVPILHEALPKFNPMMDDASQNEADGYEEADELEAEDSKKPAATNTTNAPMGSNMVRPIGSKRMKKLLKEQEAAASAAASSAGNIASMVASLNAGNNKLEDIGGNLKIMAQMRQVQMLHTLGMLDKAKEIMEESLKPPARATTSATAETSGPPSEVVIVGTTNNNNVVHDNGLSVQQHVQEVAAAQAAEIEQEKAQEEEQYVYYFPYFSVCPIYSHSFLCYCCPLDVPVD